MNVAENVSRVRRAIETACTLAVRRPSDVTIVAVTKYVGAERVKAVLAGGIDHLAENRREGLLAKQDALPGVSATWHLIGTLQTRKVKDVVNRIDFFHALDSLKLAGEIEKRLTKEHLRCFIQLNISGEKSKHGIEPAELDGFLSGLTAYPRIKIVGLMTMAPNTSDGNQIRAVFRRLRELRDVVRDRQLAFAPCTELSMGMSHDYPIAVEEGATFVRIGTALVGDERQDV
ncbi:MAG: YggS family pyridoxal phosphate-dependent enzyme [Sporolactobacillus sp.]